MLTRARQVGWIEGAEPERLWKIASGTDNSPKSEIANLRSVVEPARLLLDYAVCHGLVDSPSIIDPIIKIESDLDTHAVPSAPTLAGFLKSYNGLCRITEGVSAESLGSEARHDQRRTRRIYFLFLTGLLLLAVPLTTISTVGGKLSADAISQIGSACKDYPVLYCDPATKNQETSYDHYPFAVNDLTSRTGRISQDLWVLAVLVDWFQSENLHDDLARVSPRHDANVWSSFLETFYRSGIVIDRFKLYYGTLSNYLLPIIFGMLGAVTFGLRELRQKTEPPTWGRRGGALAVLRICIAGLAGFLVAVTGDLASEVQVSPIFIAFLLGYSIDVFFTLLDRLVSHLKTMSPVQGAPPWADGSLPSRTGPRDPPRSAHA
jgi:hypothetical protein